MGFGVTDPSYMAFKMVFSEAAEEAAILLVVGQLKDDGWDVTYNPVTREMAASNAIVKVAAPTVILGPPDWNYMGQKVYKAYCEHLCFHPPLSWDKLGDGEHEAWIKFAKAILPKQRS